MPMISAIITTFNRAHYLEKAIRSVFAQEYHDYELLILDNSSTDSTESVVRSFNDPRIRYIKHPPLDISQARNLAVKEAKGDYISFLDDDDEWLPNKLKSELSLFDKLSNNVVLVYGGFVRVDSQGKTLHTYKPKLQGMILKELLTLEDEFTGSASNPMIRKSVVIALGGFDETVKTGEDWEFYLRLAEQHQVAFVPEPVVKIRHHYGARLGDRLKDYIDLEIKVMNRFKYIFDADKKLKSYYLQRMGGKFLRLGDIKNGRAYFIDAIKYNFFNYICYIQYMLSFFHPHVYYFAHKFYLNRKRSIKI